MKEDIHTILRNLKEMAGLTKKVLAMTGFKSREYVGDTRIIELEQDGTDSFHRGSGL